MGAFSIWHWLVVLLIVVLVFGTRKLTHIGKDLGGAVRSFKEGMHAENNPTTTLPASEPSEQAIEDTSPTDSPSKQDLH